MSTRDAILEAGFGCFEANGFEAATVAAICRRAGVSNGSFFHAFPTKDHLAAELFLTALRRYHDHLIVGLSAAPSARDGVVALVGAHLEWVTRSSREARLLFERSRSEWMIHVRDRQRAENARLGRVMNDWRTPLVTAGALHDLPPTIFFAQLIGPAQIICRAWLSGRSEDLPTGHRDALVECALRSLVVSTSS